MFKLPSLPLLPFVGHPPAGRPRMRDEVRRIEGRTYGYGVVEGEGPTVVLIHGWGLAHASYRAAAEALADHGFKVILPDLPGFGASSNLGLHRISLDAYATTMRRFLEECEEIAGEAVHLIGHSFGGAVATQLAHDVPELVRSVVLVSSATGATWHRDEEVERPLTDRPLWDWGVHLVQEFPLGRFPNAAIDVLRDLSHNLVWHLPNVGMAALMIRRHDLRETLSRLREAALPAAVVWAEGDHVVTKACFDDQCQALGCEGTVVEGNHGWPLADPLSFARTIGGILRAAIEPPAAQKAS